MLVIFRAELIFEYELGMGWGAISITRSLQSLHGRVQSTVWQKVILIV